MGLFIGKGEKEIANGIWVMVTRFPCELGSDFFDTSS